MKCFVKVKDKKSGFDLAIKLNKLTAIQANSFYQSFFQYIKYVDENKKKFALVKEQKELPELILKEYEKALRKATE